MDDEAESLDYLRRQASTAFTDALAAGSWHTYNTELSVLNSLLRKIASVHRAVSKQKGERSHARQGKFGVYDVRMVRRQQTVTAAEETELWTDPAGAIAHGWDGVSLAIVAIAQAHGEAGLVTDHVWLTGQMKWRRNSVIRDGEATARVRLPCAEHRVELWLTADIVHNPEEAGNAHDGAA
jgi:hypothetical protein